MLLTSYRPISSGPGVVRGRGGADDVSGPPRRVRVVLRDVEARSPSRADGADRNAEMVRLMKSCARAAARDHHTVSQIYFSSRHFLPNSLSWRITLAFFGSTQRSVPLRLGRAKVSPPGFLRAVLYGATPRSVASDERAALGAAPRLVPLASLARLPRSFHVRSKGVEFGD